MSTILRNEHPSLQACIDVAQTGDMILVPASSTPYLETVRAVMPASKNVPVDGEGIQRSILQWTVPNGGLRIENQWGRAARVRQLSIETQVGSNAGFGFELSPANPLNSSSWRQLELTDVDIRGTTTGGHWDYCAVCYDAFNADIKVVIAGESVGGVPVGKGLFLGRKSVNVHAHVMASGLDIGVELETSGLTEGLVLGGKIMYVRCGIDGRVDAPTAGLTLKPGLHIDALQFGARLKNRPQSEIVGITIQRHDTASGLFTGLELVGCDDTRVQSCMVQKIGNDVIPTTYGIVAAASQRIMSIGNVTILFEKGQWYKPDTSQCSIRVNRGNQNTTHVQNDAGTANDVGDNQP